PHVDPIGAKGIGEIGMTGVAAAIANAVFHATGVRVREFPITLDKLFPEMSIHSSNSPRQASPSRGFGS
ncbi:MAG TPA: hypothetical protein VN797_01790, partial [Gemmatimonadaceae bacterium]|nr:hypothetical protein [Gemmatimonadaceae bacterium]